MGDSSQLLGDTMILSKDKSILTEFRFKKQKKRILKNPFFTFSYILPVITFCYFAILLFLYFLLCFDSLFS